MAFELTVAYNTFDKALTDKASALPNDFNKARFLQNCMTVLSESKDLQACDLQSVKRGVLKAAFLGLDFFSKEAYLIKYGNTAQFQTDYKGEKKLAKKYSIRPIKDIYAKLVREGDFFEELILNGEPSINFKPKSFNKGNIIGAFAVVLFEDGTMSYETMTVEEIEKIRKDFSKAPNSPAWSKTPGEMYKKTVLRRLCKNIELDFDSLEQRQAFEESSDFSFDNKTNIVNEHNNEVAENANKEVIEVDYEEIMSEGVQPSFMED